MSLPLLRNLKGITGKKVILRLDLNVSIREGKIFEDFRIRKIFPTLDFLVASGAIIFILAHLDEKEGITLEPVARYLLSRYPTLRFEKDLFGSRIEKEIAGLRNGGIILFENIRKWKGEKENDTDFVTRLASIGEIYINDAFSASHRNHASIVGIPEHLPSYIGFLFEEEVKNLSKAFHPSHPFVFILGGAKFETKIPIINKFLPLCDNMFIGGAIANTFFQAKGFFLGDSLVSAGTSNFNSDIKSIMQNNKVILPVDVRTQHKGFKYNKNPNEISVGEKIWDIGERSAKSLIKIIKEASFVIWNGPMGNIEVGEVQGTLDIARLVTSSKAFSIIGGGDSIAALDNSEYFDKFSFVSSGGGAMLDFLANETLPGIDAILKNSKKNNNPLKTSWFKGLFS